MHNVDALSAFIIDYLDEYDIEKLDLCVAQLLEKNLLASARSVAGDPASAQAGPWLRLLSEQISM